MDKRTIIGFILIFLIVMFFSNFIFKPAQPPESLQDSTAIQDSAVVEKSAGDTAKAKLPAQVETPPSLTSIDSAAFAASMETEEKIITMETGLAVYTLSSRGGTVKQVVLKDYEKYDSLKVSMISSTNDPDWARYGALTVSYNESFPAMNMVNFAVEQSDTSKSVVFTYAQPDSAILVKTYTFYDDSYLFDLNIDVISPEKLGLGQGITVGWFAPLEATEKDTNQDKGKLGGFFNTGEDFDYYKDLDEGKLRKIVTGPIDWVATRTKYFTAVVMSEGAPADEAIIVGNAASIVDFKGESKEWARYGAGLTYERPPENISLKFKIYTGPIDYNALKEMGHNLSALVDMGWKMFRPFAIAILWILNVIYSFVPNYGFVIIIFSVLMKLVFWPLSVKSAKSMHQMREIQPKLQEVKEKFKDEPAKLQQETMKVYKEYGVNPFGSCLPMLVQLPIFWALYSVLGNTIALRGADFIFWIHDLSQPDPSGAHIPLGIGILPIIMGVSMFIQQKITITDPKQKMMVYLMPALFMFLFSRWASGLVLYWTVFNIMGIFEQLFVKRNIANSKATT